MFEKEAEEYREKEKNKGYYWVTQEMEQSELDMIIDETFKDGAEYGYNKALEDVKHDLTMKLKDEGIVKPLKDSISRNERLSSQEQQELCAWIECAMDFGENLDECAEKLTEAKELLKRWVGDKVHTVSEQKDLIADTEQFLNGEVEK